MTKNDRLLALLAEPLAAHVREMEQRLDADPPVTRQKITDAVKEHFEHEADSLYGTSDFRRTPLSMRASILIYVLTNYYNLSDDWTP